MNNDFFQQAEQLFKPVTDMMALNARTFEALAEKQNGLMSGMWSEGMNCAKDLSGKRDVQSFYATQREFWESFNQRMNDTARDSYNLLTEAQQEMGKLMQDSFSSVDFPAMGMSATGQAAQQAAQEAAQQTAQAGQSTAKKSAEAAETAAKSTSKAASKTSAKTSEKVADSAKGKSGNKSNG